MLKDKDLNVRESALLPLVKLGGNEKEVLEALISSLRDREPKVAIEAARLLEPYGQKAEAAIPDLVRCLKSTDSGLRDQAALALGPIGGKDKKVLKTLITVLKDRGPMENRNALAMALGKLGTEAEEAIPTLIKALDVSDMKDKRRGRWTRLAVISAIGRIGRPVTIVVPLLLGIVKDAQADVNERVGAVNGLERIGPVAKQAVPELTRLLRSTDDTLLRAAVERAIKAIHNPEKQQ
jgi:HEAT repeat protein